MLFTAWGTWKPVVWLGSSVRDQKATCACVFHSLHPFTCCFSQNMRACSHSAQRSKYTIFHFSFSPPSKENHKRAVLISASSQDRSFVRCCFSMFPSSESTQVWYSVYCLKPGPSTWGVSVGGVNQTQVVFQDQNVIPPGLSWCVKLYTERPSQWDLGVKVLSISAMKFKAGGFGGKAG